MAKKQKDPGFVGADIPGPAYELMQALRRGSSLLMQGQAALKAAGEEFLPRWVGQTEAMSETSFQYERRRKIATLHNLYKRTIVDMVNQVFSRRLAIKPEGQGWVEAMRKNIDGEGCSHDGFLRAVAKDSLAMCISHVLVDAPPPTDAPNAQTAGARHPFWRHFPASEVIDVEPIVIGGQTRVGLVRRKYIRRVRVGPLAREPIAIVQVLERGEPGGQGDEAFASSMLLRQSLDKNGNAIGWFPEPDSLHYFKPAVNAPSEVQAMFQEIPFVGFPTSPVGFFEGDLLLDALCDLQMTHFRKMNEQDSAMSTGAVCIKLFSGWTEKQVSTVPWGPNAVLVHPDKDVDIKDISFNTAPLEFMATDLERLERRMAIAAVEPSVSRATGEEKSTIRLMDEAKRLTMMQAVALDWMASASQCWVWSAAYQGIDGRSMAVEIKEEVFEALGQASTFADLLAFWQAKRPENPLLSDKTLIEEAQRYAVLSDRVKPDEEAARVMVEAAGRAPSADTAAPVMPEVKPPAEAVR